MTFKDFPVGNASFVEYYKSLPDRRVVKAPKSAFVEYIAHKTLGVPQDQLFPEKKSANTNKTTVNQKI